MHCLAFLFPSTSGNAMALSRGLRPLLHGALVVVATVAMAMAITAAAATAMQCDNAV